VKAFSFRLEQVLRWREMQVSLQKARVAAAAGHVSQLRNALDLRKAELAASAAQIAREPTGLELGAYAAFVEKSSARIREIEDRAKAAQSALAAETDRLIEANRKLRLLEDLKRTAQGQWRAEHDRELAAFADEAFLGRLQSGKRERGLPERQRI
jgi:flagellar export protein FliJ